MRFLTTNLCSEAATTITASSADVNFPVTNLKNPLRSKRWRSNGSFEIGSTNNKINFKEAALGTELTATLTSGIYSVDALAIEIKSKMEAVGSQIYVVTFSRVTGKWTIATGGSYLSLLLSSGTNQATSVFKLALGFSNTDKTGALVYTGSQIAIHTSETLVFDFKTAQDINSAVILWPKEDGIRLSPDAVIKVEANATNIWTAPAVSQTLAVDNTYMVASVFFPNVQSYRYWRVTVNDPANPLLFIELGMIWIGENNQFDEPENGFTFSIQDLSIVSRTDFGHEYVDEYPQLNSLDFNYAYIQYPTLQSLENSFRQNGTRKPVLVVFDETEIAFNNNHFLIYGKMQKSFDVKHVFFQSFSGGLKITELG